MITFVVFILSDLIEYILECNCSLFYLDDNTITRCNFMDHSSMREVHLFRGYVAYAYWIDTGYVQNSL